MLPEDFKFIFIIVFDLDVIFRISLRQSVKKVLANLHMSLSAYPASFNVDVATYVPVTPNMEGGLLSRGDWEL